MATRKNSGLPAVSPKTDPQTRQLLESVKESIETWHGQRGNPLDKALTWRDFMDTGLVQLKGALRRGMQMGAGQVVVTTPTRDLSIPPAPTGVVASGVFRAILVSWDKPTYGNHGHARVYRGTEDDPGNAVLIGQEPGTLYTDAVDGGAGYYYWVSFVSDSGIEGPMNAVAGTYAEAPPDVDHLLTELSGQIRESELGQSLLTKVDKIGSLEESQQALSGAITGLQQDLASARQQAQQATDAAGEAALQLILHREEAEDKLRGHQSFRDAISEVDPQTGTINLYAVDALQQAMDTQFSEVQVELDAVNSTVALKASKSELDSAIEAVAAGFTPVYTWPFNNNDEGFTAENGSITVNADSISLASSAANSALIAPSVSFDGNNNQSILLRIRRDAGSGWVGKVYYATSAHGYSDSYHKAIDPPVADNEFHTLQINMAELSAGGSDYTDSTVTGLKFVLGAGAGDDFTIDRIEVGKSNINQLLYTDLQGRVSDVEVRLDADEATLTHITTELELDANNESARFASAEQTLNAHTASIDSFAQELQITAEGSRLGTVESTANAADQKITDISTRLEQDGDGNLKRLDRAEQDIAANGEGITQTVASMAATRALNEQQAEAFLSTLLNLDAKQEQAWAQQASLAVVQQQLNAHADELEAEAEQRTLLAAQIDGNAAAIETEQQARADGDSAEAEARQTLQATVDGHTATLSQHASSINGLEAQWEVKATVKDVTGGIGLFNNGTTVDVGINASRLWLINQKTFTTTLSQSPTTVTNVLITEGEILPTTAENAGDNSYIFMTLENQYGGTYTLYVDLDVYGGWEVQSVPLAVGDSYTNGDPLFTAVTTVLPFIIQDGVVHIDTAMIAEGAIQSGQLGGVEFGKIFDKDGNPVLNVAGKLKADYIHADTLSAIAANLGTVTAGILRSADNQFRIDLANSILRGGGAGFESGNGYWFGKQSGVTKAFIGNKDTDNYISWDGESLAVRGDLIPDFYEEPVGSEKYEVIKSTTTRTAPVDTLFNPATAEERRVKKIMVATDGRVLAEATVWPYHPSPTSDPNNYGYAKLVHIATDGTETDVTDYEYIDSTIILSAAIDVKRGDIIAVEGESGSSDVIFPPPGDYYDTRVGLFALYDRKPRYESILEE